MTPFPLLGLAAALAPRPVLAQPSTHTFTWEDCLAVARESNPDFAASKHTVEADEASYKSSYNGLFPAVTLSHSYVDPHTTGATIPFSYWTAGLSANLRLLNASDLANIKASAATLDIARANLRIVSANARQSLRNAFSQLLYEQSVIETTQKILDIRDHDAQMIRLRYNAGSESKGDMMRADAQVLQERYALQQAYRDLRSAQMLLSRELGLDDFQIILASGSLASPSEPARPADFYELAQGRPEVSAAQANVEAAEAGLRQSQAALFPNLSLSYSRNAISDTEFPRPFDNWTFQGLLSYPLFGGGPTSTFYNVRAARQTREQAEQSLRAARAQAVSDLQAAWSNLWTQADQVAVAAALLDADRQRNDEADIEYQSGILTYNNWDIIASQRISDETNLLTQQLQAVQALADWERVLGKGLDQP